MIFHNMECQQIISIRSRDLANRISRAISKLSKNILSAFPIEIYIEYLNRYPVVCNYLYVSQEVERFCKNIIDVSNLHMLCLYHQLMLLNLIPINVNKIREMNLPQDIKNLYALNFERIVNEIDAGHYTESYNYDEDRFRKHLAICSLRLIPAGAQKINMTRMSRRVFFQNGLQQFVRVLSCVFINMGGMQPVYEMHTDSNDPDLMADFNYSGWILFYKRIADLLKLQPNVKGVFGISWFFDPQLEKISPRLSYLRKLVTDNGGSIFYVGPSEVATQDALLKSVTRRKLYEEGKYIPVRYLLLWPRNKLIIWSEKLKMRHS